MTRLILVAFSSLIFLFQSCQQKQASEDKIKSIKNAPVTKYKLASENEIADFWAGTSDSIKNANHKEWKKYAKTLDSSFHRLERNKFSVMNTWAQTELKSYRNDSVALFYPFSGPDFFYANLLFPQAQKYVMVGLEPVGAAPTPALMKDTILFNYLNEVENSLYAIFNFGFFRTNAMRENFNKENMNGMLPLLYLFVKRRGYDIISVEKVRLAADGQFKSFPISAIDTSKDLRRVVKGVHFVIKQPNDSPTQELFYFSFDLSNANYAKHPEFEQFVRKQKLNATYLKAASCLMHKTYFSFIRNLILANSKIVLQDDSGIPIHFFEEDKWESKLFGSYTGVIKLFKGDEQPDLITRYKRDSAVIKPLPFGTGYKFNKGKSNLQLVIRK